ncbi:zinc-binding dehydrogenase [Lederbergia galactosidilytica]|uniref:Alcohol dehydrogenase n=1 Tax=Lederbergia galactosidilytica TaxID=217031 RepID=A0A177ZWY1_9BACI|nr:zinc-binding dehydrogenase [Lederbergia galactosidilytica]KRG11072.1 alcohol dehydrogenase [Virgibacillus soli]MBP1916564.1 zinc-binding alcohol dehydrogenase/oxidoreductase [Lederbergia galactosidilytica]OAK71979.1 alcohol dehydrogenase [Lederbergia galactosidilytica]
MKAVVHEGKTGFAGLAYRDLAERKPGAGEVRVKLKTVGLNHRDLFVLYRHQLSDPPLVIGSDGAGVVDSVGEDVANIKVGDEVMINPGLGWQKNSAVPPEDFEIVGFPFDGTFAEQIILPAANVVQKPAYLTWEEAGVLSLAALTAYRALFTRGRIKPNMKILIPGIGSGVATFLLQFAKAVGATVFVTSRSKEKCEKALELGADKAIDSQENWDVALDGEKMDLVIESVGAATFSKSLNQLRPGGTIVTFGASAGDDVQINIRDFFYGQFNLLGSTMGSAEEYNEMLQFIEKHEIKPVIDQVYPLEQYAQGFKRMESANQFGKIAFLVD